MKVGCFIISNGELYGKEDFTRLDNAKWYQKLLAKISKRYKMKFMDIMPIEMI